MTDNKYRGMHADRKPRCSSCKGFLPMNFEKIVCPNCAKANRQYKRAKV